MTKRTVWWPWESGDLGEEVISLWTRGSDKIKSLVRSTIDNPLFSILFWTSPYLFWKPWDQVNLPLDSYSCQLLDDCCTREWDISQMWVLAPTGKLYKGTLRHKQLCMHTTWKGLWESVSFNVFGWNCNLLLYCHNITQKPFLLLFLLWFYIYLPRSRKDMQKWTRYSSILRTSQLRCFRSGLLYLSECSNRALEPEFCSQLCRYWLLLWIDSLTFLCL